MRPLSLTVDGFRSYASPHTFDFRDRRLVGVVGPIGSGKSSLLDAMAFALYGKTPTVESATKSLINQRLDEARVELWFEAGGETWRAVRALRRKGQGAATLTRHDSLDPDSDRIEGVIGTKPMTEHVEKLLGLDFRGFTRSVLLAQNQFAEFLNARPGDRDAVLKGVFGFDRVDAMHQVAKARRDDAARDLEELQRRRGDIEKDRAELEQTRADLKTSQESAAALATSSSLVAALQEEVTTAVRGEQAATDRLEELHTIAERFPASKETNRFLRDAERDAEARRIAEETATDAAAALNVAEDNLAGVVTTYGGPDELSAAEHAIAAATAAEEAARAAQARLDNARADTATTAATAAEAGLAEKSALEARDKAETVLASAREAAHQSRAALHTAQHAEMAHTVRSVLVAGEACPVCDQLVAIVPSDAVPSGVKKAQAAQEAAESAESAAAAAVERATGVVAAAGKDRAATEARATAGAGLTYDLESEWITAGATATELRAAVIALIGDEGLRAQTGDWKKALTEASEARQSAAGVATRTRSAVDNARDAAEQRAAGLQRLASEIAGLSGRLNTGLEPAATPPDLRGALEAMRKAWQQAVATAEDEAKAAAKQRQEATGGLAELLKEFDVASAADFTAALNTARSVVAGLASKAELLEERVARVAELEAENATTLARHGLFERLSDDLTPSKFLSYLLDEERAKLSHLGSDLFEMLSAERYRFTDDGKFAVVDLAAAERVRTAESLSGGETFLASLALALALAEMVSREGGRLDAFMLDEGFGSLDAEHLDLAMQGIERLVAESSHRLVIVVSHVAELRERCDDLIVLDKDPVTGNSIVR